jgi:hypothetical protein
MPKASVDNLLITYPPPDLHFNKFNFVGLLYEFYNI